VTTQPFLAALAQALQVFKTWKAPTRLSFIVLQEKILTDTMNDITKISDITLRVSLSAEQGPVKIEWGASDRNGGALEECKAMAVALFDKEHRDRLRIDLWTKELQVAEMDRFMYQTLRSLSATYLKATQNKELAEEMAKFAHYFGKKRRSFPKESKL